MPSEEDSDDEVDVKRRSKFMSGTALELSAEGLKGNGGRLYPSLPYRM